MSMRGLAAFGAVALVATLTGCTRVEQGVRYFLLPCAESGPVPARDFDVKIPDFDLDAYYTRLRALDGPLDVRTIGEVRDDVRSYPILRLDRRGNDAARTMLIVVGIHGNEIAGTIAVARWLERSAAAPAWPYPAWNLTVVTPANPIDHAHGSRYNGQGCDLNRDFGPFANVESALVRDVLEDVEPDLVLSLHEGPQDGFFVIVTASGDPAVGDAMAEALAREGLPLATKSFLGQDLGHRPGVYVEGLWMTGVKRLIRIHSLGAWLHDRGVGTYTTETSWHGEDAEARIRSHIVAIEAAPAAEPR